MSSSADQVTFLLGCIKHTNNGKIDFDTLAAELSLTKNAAYKRYTRLKARAQESDFSAGSAPCTPSGDDNDANGAPPTPTCTPKAKRARAAGSKTAAAKPATKRKRAQVGAGQEEDENDNNLAACRPPKRQKAAVPDQDRCLQEQILADADASRLVAETDVGDCQNAAQVKEEEAYSNMAFGVVEDETI